MESAVPRSCFAAPVPAARRGPHWKRKVCLFPVRLFQVPALLWQAAPMFLQVVFIQFLAVGQFVAIFWFLSRGGVEVYYPDDVKTRFTDVWGQDHVVERVKENIVYLENPEAIK